MVKRFKTSKFNYVLNVEDPLHDELEGCVYVLRKLRLAKLKLKKRLKL